MPKQAFEEWFDSWIKHSYGGHGRDASYDLREGAREAWAFMEDQVEALEARIAELERQPKD